MQRHIASATPLLAALLACAAGAGCVDAAAGGSLRVVTYNVARGYAYDLAGLPVVGAALPDRLSMATALRDDPSIAGAAVVALQEVCGDRGETHVAALADALWRGAPPSVVFRRADPDSAGACAEGTAIVSRLPMRDAGWLELPAVGGLRRTAVWAELDLRADAALGSAPLPGPDADADAASLLRIYSVHLHHRAEGMSDAEGRRREMAHVLADVAAWRAAHPGQAVVVAGDLNTLEAVEPALTAADTALDSALAPGTATHLLGWTLDWVFYAGLARRGADTLPLPLSDHFAVRADFDVGAPAEAATAAK